MLCVYFVTMSWNVQSGLGRVLPRIMPRIPPGLLGGWACRCFSVDSWSCCYVAGDAAGGRFSMTRIEMVVLSITIIIIFLVACVCFIYGTVYVFEYIAGPWQAQAVATRLEALGAGEHVASPPAACAMHVNR